MTLEIFIENRKVDVDGVISSLLTFAIDDVKNFAARSTAFSKTVILPGTFRNNQVFGNIFEAGHANRYDSTLSNIGYNFNAAKSARCLIFQDNLQTFKGTVRLLEIVNNRGRLEYEVALHGELTGLNVALSSGYLEDLDFSDYDHDYTVANIEASWDNYQAGAGYYYPLIDYGTYSDNKHDWQYKTFRPALFVKEYIDKMFDAAGFRYESALFETDRFKSLIIPHNQRALTKVGTQVLSAATSSGFNQSVDDPSGIPSNWEVYLAFDTVSATDFSDAAGGTVFEYTGSDTQVMTFSFSGVGSSVFTAYGLTDAVAMAIVHERAGVRTYLYTLGVPETESTITIPPQSVTMETGDMVYVLIWGTDTNGNMRYDVSFTSAALTVEAGVQSINTNLGDSVVINSSIPKNIRQIDFFTSIVKLFNLYVYETKFDDRLMKIAPFVDFYNTYPKDALDWTYKLNRSEPIRFRPMSELNYKVYSFKYADDSDYYNDLYKKRYNQTYGAYIYDTEYEFASQTTTVPVIFAPTPLVGYEGEDKVYSTIFKRTGGATPVEDNFDCVIRILQANKKTGVTSWDILDDASVLGSYTSYGYAGHFDDPDNIGADLNFGALQELFFTYTAGDLSKHQFNEYWDTYMAEITHKDSKLLIGKFYLTAQDIFDLDFSKLIYVDGILYRLNKIIDYNVSSPDECTVELLKFIDDYGDQDPYLLYQGPAGDYDHPLIDGADDNKFYYHPR